MANRRKSSDRKVIAKSAASSKTGSAGRGSKIRAKESAASRDNAKSAGTMAPSASVQGNGPESNGNGSNGSNGKVRCKSLVIDGTKYRTRINQKFEKRKTWNNPDSRKITSSIPGTIIKIFVTEGKEVKAGDQMLVLEAMKMKNKILFHTEGTVKSVHVKEGEKIPKDFLMLELK